MAKKNPTPTDEEILAGLVAQKRAAGLSEADALEVAQRQRAHDKESADREAADAQVVADRAASQAELAQQLADQARAAAAESAAKADHRAPPPAE